MPTVHRSTTKDAGHIAPDRLLVATPDPGERAHFELCARCRTDRMRAMSFTASSLAGSAASPSASSDDIIAYLFGRSRTAASSVEPRVSIASAIAPRPSDDTLIGERVEHYTIEARIGEGAMATVYRARHLTLRSLHAIKVLHTRARSVRERTIQEGKVQANIHHPNMVRVTDVVTVRGGPGLVMEYIAGPSLETLLERARPPLSQVDEVVHGILLGLVEAHGHGWVHRDLKPANILCDLNGDGITPKIADFGLVKDLTPEEGDASHTRTGSALGTPLYMSPEQIRDAKSVDHRSDLWSLGAIIYEMVTGVKAFGGRDLLEIYSRITAGEYRPPGEFVPDIPQRMADTIAGALVVDPNGRYPTARAMLASWYGQSGLRRLSPPRPPPSPSETYDEAEGQPTVPDVPRPQEPAPAAVPAPIPPEFPWTDAEDDRPSGHTVTEIRPEPELPTTILQVRRPRAPPANPRRRTVRSTPSATLAALSGALATAVAVGLLVLAVLLGWTLSDTLSGSVDAVASAWDAVAERVRPVELPAARRQTPPAEKGFLRINAHPYSEVELDGVLAGGTQLWSRQLAAGRYTVRLQSSEDERSKILPVEVKAGEETRICWDFDAGQACATQ